MRAISRTLAASLGLAALAACGGEERGSAGALSDELRQDLESAASSSQLELASAARDYKPQMVVSDLEKGLTGAPQLSIAPKRKVRAPAPRPEPKVSEEPEPVYESAPEATTVTASAPSPEGTPEPSETAPVATRPTPIPVTFPTTGTGDDVGQHDRGPGIGDVIAVVLRGGGVGEDRCEIHDRRRRGGRIGSFPGSVMINNRFPVVGRTTFPRY